MTSDLNRGIWFIQSCSNTLTTSPLQKLENMGGHGGSVDTLGSALFLNFYVYSLGSGSNSEVLSSSPLQGVSCRTIYGPDRLCVRIAGVGAKGNMSGIHTEIIPLQLHEIMRSTCLSSSESISGTHSEFF